VRRPPHRRPRRLGAKTLIGSLLVTTLALAGAVVANAETPGQKAERLRSQAADVQATIDGMNDQVETVVEQYNGNQEALNSTKARQAETASQLDEARKRLDSAQNVLGDRARSIYMHGPVSGVEQILQARSVSDAVAVAQYQQSASNADTQTIAEVRQSRQQLATVAASLADERKRQEALQSRLNQQRGEIEGKLGDQRRLLNSLSAGARQALAEEERRQERIRSQEMARKLAADRAAKAAAAAANGSGASTSSGAATESGGSGGSMAAPAGTPAASTGAPSAAAAQAIAFARAQMGKPYVWGGNGPNGFDCSGLTMMAYKSAGISIPRVAADQYTIGTHINDQSQLMPGDLVFFAHGSASSIHHVGIYIGNGDMIEAPFSGANVRVHTINRSGYFGATRPTG
jgi:cell wall-associated NlpC family hydrolase